MPVIGCTAHGLNKLNRGTQSSPLLCVVQFSSFTPLPAIQPTIVLADRPTGEEAVGFKVLDEQLGLCGCSSAQMLREAGCSHVVLLARRDLHAAYASLLKVRC